MKIEIDKVYNIDCLELMEEMEKQNIIVDWLITDPPYGINCDSGIGGNGVCNVREYTKKIGIRKE